MLPLIGAAIGAGASLLGSWFSSKSAEENRESQERMAAQNIALQKEFAQSGVQWKVQDALKAGVHPLAALGAQTVGFSPVQVGGFGDTSMGKGLAEAGQHIGRALSAAGTAKERDALTGTTAALALENQQLQNEFLRSRIALTRSQIGPPAPTLTPTDPFEHPTAKKPEDNPGIMMGGIRVLPHPAWSPMKAIQDRYGDEGPVNWGTSIAVAVADAEKNFGPIQTWPKQLAESFGAELWRQLKAGTSVPSIRFQAPSWNP